MRKECPHRDLAHKDNAGQQYLTVLQAYYWLINDMGYLIQKAQPTDDLGVHHADKFKKYKAL